jgi:hypothetical protein
MMTIFQHVKLHIFHKFFISLFWGLFNDKTDPRVRYRCGWFTLARTKQNRTEHALLFLKECLSFTSHWFPALQASLLSVWSWDEKVRKEWVSEWVSECLQDSRPQRNFMNTASCCCWSPAARILREQTWTIVMKIEDFVFWSTQNSAVPLLTLGLQFLLHL